MSKQYATLITTLSEDRGERVKQLARYGAEGWQLASEMRDAEGNREGTFQRVMAEENIFTGSRGRRE